MKESNLKKMIQERKQVFALGLAGPDLFFYYVPDMLPGKVKIGSILHEQSCGLFLIRLLEEALARKGEEQTIALSYLMGFIGHYELDTHCHPYVYSYIEEKVKKKERETGKQVSGREKTGIHFRFEGAMDSYFFQKYKKGSPARLNQNELTRLTRKERKVVCDVVAAAAVRTYDPTMLSAGKMHRVLRFVEAVMFVIRDKRGNRERLLAPVEGAVFGYPFMSGLFVNDNRYGIGTAEWEAMKVLFDRGLEEYQKTLAALDALYGRLSQEKDGIVFASFAEQKEVAEFVRQLGSRSYHTGETVG